MRERITFPALETRGKTKLGPLHQTFTSFRLIPLLWHAKIDWKLKANDWKTRGLV